MKYIIDTGSWLKFDKIISTKVFEKMERRTGAFLPAFYAWLKKEGIQLAITHAVKDELQYFHSTSYWEKQLLILPVGDKAIFDQAKNLGLDQANAEVASNGPGFALVSEDKDLLEFAILKGFTALQLIDLLCIFTWMGFFLRDEFYNVLQEFVRLRLITKRKAESIESWRVSGTPHFKRD